MENYYILLTFWKTIDQIIIFGIKLNAIPTGKFVK